MRRKGPRPPCLCELRIGDGPGAGCRGKVSSRFGVPPFSSRRLFPPAASHLALPELRLSPATSFLALHRGHESDVIAGLQTDHRRFFFFYSFLILCLVGFSLVSTLSRPLHRPWSSEADGPLRQDTSTCACKVSSTTTTPGLQSRRSLFFQHSNLLDGAAAQLEIFCPSPPRLLLSQGKTGPLPHAAMRFSSRVALVAGLLSQAQAQYLINDLSFGYGAR